MPKVTAEEASLINDVEFLEELEQFARADERSPGRGLEFPADPFETFDALEAGLPSGGAAQTFQDSNVAPLPIADRWEPPARLPAPVEPRVPFVAAALVLAACMTVGAATAALVLHERVAQITAQWPATR